MTDTESDITESDTESVNTASDTVGKRRRKTASRSYGVGFPLLPKKPQLCSDTDNPTLLFPRNFVYAFSQCKFHKEQIQILRDFGFNIDGNF